MFRQEDSRQLYPHVDLSPLPPSRPATKSMRRSHSSDALSMRQRSMHPLHDSLPVQPARRMTMANKNGKVKPKGFRRSYSSGTNLEEISTTPLQAADELRRQNSANSLRCLPRSAVPKRPSLIEQEQQEQELLAQDQRRSRRRSQESERQAARRRRHRSADDLRHRIRQEEEEEEEVEGEDNAASPHQGRRVIGSARAGEDHDFSGRRGRSRGPATSRQEQGIPGSIKIVRGHSCGGRIPSSAVAVDPLPIKIRHHDEDDDDCYSTASEEDDESTSSSVDDEFDEGSLGMMFGSVHAENNACNRTHVSSLTTDINWRNCDGSIRSTSSPENRETLQRSISEAMSSLSGTHSGNNGTISNSPLMQMQAKVMQDTSKRTEPTSRMQDCGGSVISNVSGVSQHQFHVNMMRPWICLCGEDNEADFNFCGMCAAPQKWTCTSCDFNRNKNRSPHCGGCGLRRSGVGGGNMGDNSDRSYRSVPIRPYQ